MRRRHHSSNEESLLPTYLPLSEDQTLLDNLWESVGQQHCQEAAVPVDQIQVLYSSRPGLS